MAISPVTGNFPTPSADMIKSKSDPIQQADFLRMLVAQMTSQDPLNPLEGQEFASQLAQFSSLQELQTIGATLDQSLQANLLLTQSINNTTAATIIGKVVRAEMNNVQVGSSGDTTLHYALESAATKVTVTIRNSEGDVVRTIEVPNAMAGGDHTLHWDGKDNSGIRVAEGDYTVSVAATDADGNSIGASTFIQGVVTGLRYADGTVQLLMGDTQILLSQVISVSNPNEEKRI